MTNELTVTRTIAAVLESYRSGDMEDLALTLDSLNKDLTALKRAFKTGKLDEMMGITNRMSKVARKAGEIAEYAAAERR